MVNQQLLDYIRNYVAKGYTIQQVYDFLIKQGHNPAEVNEAAAVAGGNAPQQTAPSQQPLPGAQMQQLLPQQTNTLPDAGNTNIKKRNLVLVLLFYFITFGIYPIYWIVSTKNEINRLGAKIPTAWLLIIPIVSIYWLYKYAEGFSTKLRQDNNTVLWFLLFWFVGIVTPIVVQLELNKRAA